MQDTCICGALNHCSKSLFILTYTQNTQKVENSNYFNYILVSNSQNCPHKEKEKMDTEGRIPADQHNTRPLYTM